LQKVRQMSIAEPKTLERELSDAYAARRTDVVPPSAREGGIDLATAHLVDAEHARVREAAGHRVAGIKVGYANKAMWRALKLDTLVWARMYDDTVHVTSSSDATLSIAHMTAPKIEPEIVFALAAPIPEAATDAAAVLQSVEWLALGFEIIDSVYAEWKFQPVDFVASFGLHAALVVGTPLRVDDDNRGQIAEALPTFKVQLAKNGITMAEGSGKNSLRSPALCLAELSAAIRTTTHTAPLAAGDLISSGTLTDSQFIAAGDTWTATVDGLDLLPLKLRVL
jgi:2-oxo-3-hexenedioate decarboxylase